MYPSIYYNIPSAPFEITPSPLTVAVEQEVATFYCQHLSSVGIYWLVNGTSLNIINSPNITTSSSGTMHSLSIGTLFEYSGTTAQCVAVFFDGSPTLSTPPVTLLTQGISIMTMYKKCICTLLNGKRSTFVRLVECFTY